MPPKALDAFLILPSTFIRLRLLRSIMPLSKGGSRSRTCAKSVAEIVVISDGEDDEILAITRPSGSALPKSKR